MDSKGKATLNYAGDKALEFPVYGGTIGPDVVDIRALYGKTGMFTYDPGFLSTRRAPRRSPTSTATRASCSTAAIPSSSSRCTATSSRSATC